MALCSLHNVILTLGGSRILDGVDLHIEAGERACLVGRNGAGKSSLMGLFTGRLHPDSGEVILAPGLVPGFMPQDVPQDWQGTVFDLVAQGLGQAGDALGAAHLIATGREKDLDPARRAAAEQALALGDTWERHGEVIGVINSLGLDPETDFTALSGGTRRRVALARALIASNDLFLDEPTNHLDVHTIAWLEDFLARRARTLLFISHDRAFASRLATRIIDIDRGKLYSYACSYGDFLEKREERLQVEAQQAAAFDKVLAREEAWIRQGIKARRTRNMGRVRDLQALRRERATRQERQGPPVMQAQEAERSGKLVIEARDVAYVFPDGFEVFSGVSALIQRKDRIGLIGRNGAGKTTLLRLLLGELEPSAGTVRHGVRLEVAYFDQLRTALDPTRSVMDSVADGNDTVIIDGRQRHVAGYLKDFLFEPSRLRLPVGALSGGERNRLLLARLFTRPSNVLVLDEPTNDLDVETLELLEELLDNYTGTVLMVSHDRTFLDNLATGTLALEGDRRVRTYVGGYTDWLRQRDPHLDSDEGTRDAPPAPRKPLVADNSPPLAPRKISFKEQREQQELEAEQAALPERLASLEHEQAELEKALADPSFFTRDPEGFVAAGSRLAGMEEAQLALLERAEAVEARLSELAALKQ